MLALVGLLLVCPSANAASAAAPRPNILWISCEDASPWFGFCGEPYAATPNLDRLARSGVHYTNAFATAPVCSPSRFAIITGIHATTAGTQRLRSEFAVAETIHAFPAALRAAGYYCANNVKTDYNTSAARRLTDEAWDESSRRAHWRNRPADEPFFAVFNLEETHQSKAFETATTPVLEPAERHDPARAPLPPYYPDVPAARRTMARVHDCITVVDRRVGQLLSALKQDGLDDDTLVFFWSDHGQGIPRGKRTLWDTGLQVPLVVYFPERYRHWAPVAAGEKCRRLISLIDLGPTLLSLLELPIPANMQGRAFLGPAAAEPRRYVFGARDRVDEADDVSRSVRDERYLYLRNFRPDLSWNQPEYFSDQLDLRREITRLAAAGKLNAAQLTYAAATKSPEALYDVETDPWQIRNLADDAEHRPVLERMRRALRDWQIESHDLGLLHESRAAQLEADGRPLAEAAAAAAYPLERILDTADRVGRAGQVAEFVRRLADDDATVRYWAAVGLRAAGDDAPATRAALARALDDDVPSVRIEAAGVLAARWNDARAVELLSNTLADADDRVSLHAARTLQLLGETARPALPAMQRALASKPSMFLRFSLMPAVERLTGESLQNN